MINELKFYNIYLLGHLRWLLYSFCGKIDAKWREGSKNWQIGGSGLWEFFGEG